MLVASDLQQNSWVVAWELSASLCLQMLVNRDLCQNWWVVAWECPAHPWKAPLTQSSASYNFALLWDTLHCKSWFAQHSAPGLLQKSQQSVCKSRPEYVCHKRYSFVGGNGHLNYIPWLTHWHCFRDTVVNIYIVCILYNTYTYSHIYQGRFLLLTYSYIMTFPEPKRDTW